MVYVQKLFSKNNYMIVLYQNSNYSKKSVHFFFIFETFNKRFLQIPILRRYTDQLGREPVNPLPAPA